MDYTTYRQELDGMSHIDKDNHVISNYIVNIFSIIKAISLITNRGKGYVNHMSKNKSPNNALDVLNVLKSVIDDNEVLLNDDLSSLGRKISTYITLINDNIDNVIRSNSNIIYDEDENDIPLPEININCDMIAEISALIMEMQSIIHQ